MPAGDLQSLVTKFEQAQADMQMQQEAERRRGKTAKLVSLTLTP